jgi:AraC-like DNA-binding protein
MMSAMLAITSHAGSSRGLQDVVSAVGAKATVRSQRRPQGQVIDAPPRPVAYRKAWTALTAQVDEHSVTRAPLNANSCPAVLTDQPWFLVMLEEVGGRVRTGPASRAVDFDHAMHFAPAGTEVPVSWDGAGYARRLKLQIDLKALPRLFGETASPRLPSAPKWNFFDRRLLGLARLMEVECLAECGSGALYGDGLSIGLLSLLAFDTCEPQRRSGGLTARQMRLVANHMAERFDEAVTLEDLAELVRLSPSHFCRMFKAATGVTPHRWLNNLRIDRAKALLLAGEPLAQVALATGFNDQPHLTRVFGQTEGVSPGAWRRQRVS